MVNISKFVYACAKNKVIEVKRMISEGVNINGVNSKERTGLMVAMYTDNTEVSRILLSCNNIKIDIKDKNGETALHYACYYNHAESVKLFLEHPTCNKDIVRTEDMWGRTAEMRADLLGYKKCAKLIREYLENNDDREIAGTVEDVRSVDDLVKYLENDNNMEIAATVEDVRSVDDLVEYLENNDDRKNTGTVDDKLSYEPNKELLEFIDDLICSTCRPKMSNCPECRVVSMSPSELDAVIEDLEAEEVTLKEAATTKVNQMRTEITRLENQIMKEKKLIGEFELKSAADLAKIIKKKDELKSRKRLRGDERFLMPVFQRKDGVTIKLGYIVSREKGGVMFAVRNIMIRQANLSEVTLTISPVEINGPSVELKNEEIVCDIDDVQLVNDKNISVNAAMYGMELVAKSIASCPVHVQKLARKHQLAVAMRKEAQRFLGGSSTSEISSLGCVDWRLDPDILQLERNNDFCVEYRIEESKEQASTMDLLMGKEWDVRCVSGMAGYRIILTLEVTVDSNQELTMKMDAMSMTGNLDSTCYRTECLRDTAIKRLSDSNITQDWGSRANTLGLSLSWDELKTQSAEHSLSHAPCVPSATVSMDDTSTGSGSVGFPTATSTSFQSLERLLSSIPQSQLVFNSPIKEVNRELAIPESIENEDDLD